VEYGAGGNFSNIVDGMVRGVFSVGKRHEVRITGLSPGQTYNYRSVSTEVTNHAIYFPTVGSTVKSSSNQFTTFNTAKESFTFYFVTDLHNSTSQLNTLLGLINWNITDFCANGGDQITDLSATDDATVLSSFIDPCTAKFAKNKPIVYARGNHEYRGSISPKVFSYMPNESGRFFYTFAHGPAHFLIFDSGEDKSDSTTNLGGVVAVQPYLDMEYAWYQNYVQTNASALSKIPFKIGIIHDPAWGYQTNPTRWNTVANNAGMNLLLAGHTHSFSHQTPTTARKFHTLVLGQGQLCKVTVSKTVTNVVTYNSSGSKVDSFAITTQVDIGQQHVSTNGLPPKERTFKVQGARFVFPEEFAGKTKSVAVYTLTGRLLQKTISNDKKLVMEKTGEKAKGMYIVKVTILPAVDENR